MSYDCFQSDWYPFTTECYPSPSDPQCSNQNAAVVWWGGTEPGKKYEISIGGRTAGSVGNFELTLTEVVIPSNSKCSVAEEIIVPRGSSSSVTSSTLTAINSGLCGEDNDVVWYSFVGTGSTFKVTTCSAVTDFATQVTVSSDCDSSTCTASVLDLDCSSNPFAAAVEWLTEAGVIYDISVGGRSNDVEGNFELTVTEKQA
jgi:hypothetical protein